MSEFIRVTVQNSPATIARSAILHTRAIAGGTRITLRDSLTIVDVEDAPGYVADVLMEVSKNTAEEKPEPKKNEPDPKATK